MDGGGESRQARKNQNADFGSNLGILLAFGIFYLGVYLVATEFVSSKKPKGEVLVFRRGHQSDVATASDIESSSGPASIERLDIATKGVQDVALIEKHAPVFHWKDICFDITIGKEKRRILDHVDGWIKPGTVTALLASSFSTSLINGAEENRLTL
jgi:hypothetical protein